MMAANTYLDEHVLQADRQVFRLDEDIATLWNEIGDHNRRGMALAKESGLNVVLTVARGGQHLRDHRPRGASTMHVIDGRLRVFVEGEPVECSAGQIVALDCNVRRDVEVVEDSAFLTTVALDTTRMTPPEVWQPEAQVQQG